MSDDDDYDAADSGAANCTPLAAGDARKGGFILIKGKPCKIIDCSKAKVGKHGAAKCHFIGVDIFTGKKLESICPASASLSEPIVTRIEYQLCDVTDDGFLSLMAKDNSMRDDLKLPDDETLSKKIRTAYDAGDELMLTVLGAVGTEQTIEMKKTLA
ncbi:eukaryotic translation initiation factor 5A-1/2 [Baffinella frigidus]|nr:eukaryotic translation initiation factor 5A-1/2 [Cryptophyta sp. CCMP2293]